MSFWSSETLKRRLPGESLIEGYSEARVKCGSYELTVGSNVVVTSKGKPTPCELPKVGATAEIPPGQFALLITEEIVKVPGNAIAFISIRARIKFQGIVNVSGFHVDPGFEGRLKFSIYNAGARSVYIARGDPIFVIWYTDLDQTTTDLYSRPHEHLNQIGSADLNRMEGEVASPGQLREDLKDLDLTLNRKVDEIVSKLRGEIQLNQRLLTICITGLLAFVLKSGCSSLGVFQSSVDAGAKTNSISTVITTNIVILNVQRSVPTNVFEFVPRRVGYELAP